MIFKSLWDDDGLNPERILKELQGIADSGKFEKLPFGMLVLGTAYAIQAIKCDERGEQQLAWTYAVDAMGYARGIYDSYQHGKAAGPTFAQLGAKARHANHRAMRERVIAEYLSNIHRYKSKDAAAEEIAARMGSVTFRTVRSWLNNL